MNIVVFDTETANLEKPFAYNIGYLIFNTDTAEILIKRDFVVEQIWHNKELFTTAYYANKRELYISRMRARACRMEKIGYITQLMARDFKFFDVSSAYAYNASFDDRVFTYNCEWFKIQNPFDDIPIYDIRGYVHNKIAFMPEYQKFCDTYEQYTETRNYSTTAESVYRFINNAVDFEEEHTALADSEIELQILRYCIEKGCEWNKEYKVYNSIRRKAERKLIVNDADGTRWVYPYSKITVYKEKDDITRINLRK